MSIIPFIRTFNAFSNCCRASLTLSSLLTHWKFKPISRSYTFQFCKKCAHIFVHFTIWWSAAPCNEIIKAKHTFLREKCRPNRVFCTSVCVAAKTKLKANGTWRNVIGHMDWLCAARARAWLIQFSAFECATAADRLLSTMCTCSMNCGSSCLVGRSLQHRAYEFQIL